MKVRSAPPKPRHELVRQELLDKAAEIFEKKGYGQATIQDVAEALHLSRSALYHYFKSKDDILLALVAERAGSAAAEMKTMLASAEPNAASRLRLLLTRLIRSRLEDGASLRALDQLANEMPTDIRKAFDRGRRAVLETFAGVIRAGVENGELRPIDPKLAALAVLGIASWTSWWYSPSGRKSPEELARILVDIALNGLVMPEGDRFDARSPRQMVRSLRKGLEALERTIEFEDDD